ncbi:MAG: hypothetical protein HY520_01775 [Candidatus Aenigmarchaeota archaeon]|nr:hypothetical protein [Candidatus Aenigmarchaeota archaeon]
MADQKAASPPRAMYNPDSMVCDDIRKEIAGHPNAPALGYVLSAGPFEMDKIIDFTGLRGSGSNIYYSLIYQLPKWGFTIKKVDEYIEVTPAWAEYYNLTIAQKQKLEASIKTGLASAAQSVADYELLKHDFRRYQEVLDYFAAADKTKDEHMLRSLFVDRVDAFTGEGYSMISMAKRWPTIITDFIRMPPGVDDPKEIKEKVDVTMAEATVLRTKNQLYQEWKALFLPELKDRIARLKVLLDSRRKSIDEYRLWLKPYMARYKAIREQTELKPAAFMSDAFHTPGFGQAQALTGVKLWFWKPFTPPEKGKPESIKERGARHGFRIDPFDGFVRENIPRILERYGLAGEYGGEDGRVSEKMEKAVENILKEATPKVPKTYNAVMNKDVVYYTFFTADVILALIRTPPPEGVETDNLMFHPIKAHVISQNLLLLHLIEIWARERMFEREINELIGTREAEESALEAINKRFGPEVEERMRRLEGVRRAWEKGAAAKGRAQKPLSWVYGRFVRPGPYERVFKERGSKMYARGIGGDWSAVTGFLMDKMQMK